MRSVVGSKDRCLRVKTAAGQKVSSAIKFDSAIDSLKPQGRLFVVARQVGTCKIDASQAKAQPKPFAPLQVIKHGPGKEADKIHVWDIGHSPSDLEKMMTIVNDTSQVLDVRKAATPAFSTSVRIPEATTSGIRRFGVISTRRVFVGVSILRHHDLLVLILELRPSNKVVQSHFQFDWMIWVGRWPKEFRIVRKDAKTATIVVTTNASVLIELNDIE